MAAHSPQTPRYSSKEHTQHFDSYLLFKLFSALKDELLFTEGTAKSHDICL